MKFVFAVAFVAILAFADAHPQPKNIITDIIEAIIDKNRDKLADLTIESIDLGEFGSVNNLNIKGADKFVVEKLEANGPLSIDIKNATVTLATASATADYSFKNVQIPELGITVNGDGSLSGSITNGFATVTLDLSLDGLIPQVNDFTNLEITVEAIQATLTGIDNADAVNEVINTKLAGFLSANLALIAEANKADIIIFINDLIRSIV